VANGRYLAGPFAAAPDASVQNSRLDVFTLGSSRRRSFLLAAWQWVRGHHIYTPEARYFTASSLLVESLRGPCRVDIDGEVNEITPLQLEVLPRALRVVVPKGFIADEA
jgi:diacylglycerol kinase family enzyme